MSECGKSDLFQNSIHLCCVRYWTLVAAVCTLARHCSPLSWLRSAAATTARYSGKFGLARTGPELATAPRTRCGYFSRSQPDSEPG